MKPSWSAARTAAALTFVALVAVPIFANPLSARVFDPERAILLRLLCIPALFAAMLAMDGIALRTRIDLGAALYFLGTLLSCFFSEAPSFALSGEYARQMGILTDVALIGVMLGAARIGKVPATSDLLMRALLLVGAAHGILAGIEAITSRTLEGRAIALAGGATFLGSHLGLLLPVAIARTKKKTDILVTLAIAIGLLASGSRVALLAAGAGIGATAMLRGGRAARRIVLGLIVAVGLVAISALPPIRTLFPDQSLPARVGALFQSGDVEQRWMLYRDALHSLWNEPLTLLTGHGPDSIGTIFSADISESLQRRLGGRARLDRFHCDLLDLLFTRGILGLVGLLVLLVSAIVSSRRQETADSEKRGLYGLLIAALVDSLLSVPGVTSRLFVFAAAGLVEDSAPEARVAKDAPLLSTSPSTRPAGSVAGLVVATAAIAIFFATAGDARSLVALALVPLLVVNSPLRAILTGCGALVFFVFARFLVALGFDIGSYPEMAAMRSFEIGLVDVALIGIALVLARALGIERGAAQEAPPREQRPLRIGLSLTGVVLVGLALRDDVLRQSADAHAAIATAAQHDVRRPEIATDLLDRATQFAPETLRYEMRAALARVDIAESKPSSEVAALEELWVKAAERIHAVSRRAPRDGFLLAEGADGLLRLASRIPSQRGLIIAHAASLARPALAYAPYALPALQVNARLELELDHPDMARSLLERALTIDNSPGLTHVLMGRASARQGEVASAAWYYALALSSNVGRGESLAGIALAAAAQGGTSESAQVVLELTAIANRYADLRAEVRGARPLLRYVAWDRLVAVMAKAEQDWKGDRATFERVRDALDY